MVAAQVFQVSEKLGIYQAWSPVEARRSALMPGQESIATTERYSGRRFGGIRNAMAAAMDGVAAGMDTPGRSWQQEHASN
jgi:hypothetical protein